jgi:hypothetical protein
MMMERKYLLSSSSTYHITLYRIELQLERWISHMLEVQYNLKLFEIISLLCKLKKSLQQILLAVSKSTYTPDCLNE